MDYGSHAGQFWGAEQQSTQHQAAVPAGCAHRSQACAVGLGDYVGLLPHVLPNLQEWCKS